MIHKPVAKIEIKVRLKDGCELLEVIDVFARANLASLPLPPVKDAISLAIQNMQGALKIGSFFCPGNLWVNRSDIAAVQFRVLPVNRAIGLDGLDARTARIIRSIEKSGEDVRAMADHEILRWPNVGRVGLAAIKKWIKETGE